MEVSGTRTDLAVLEPMIDRAIDLADAYLPTVRSPPPLPVD